MRPRRKFHLLSEINITPLTDVMLVLLVIFMATSSFIVTGSALELNLPQAGGKPLETAQKTLIIEIDREGAVALQGQKLTLSALKTRLTEEKPPSPPVVLKIDRNCPYRNFISLLDFLSARGFNRVSLAVEEKSVRD